MFRLMLSTVLVLVTSLQATAEETFVTIHKVVGSRLTISKASTDGRGRRGGAQTSPNSSQQSGMRRGRGRFANRDNTTAVQQAIVTVTVPSSAKITSGMKERRTFEFRAGAELAGGLRNRIFQKMTKPLSARIVTTGNRITEVNVITGETDINQSNTDGSGLTVIAIRPKRPPMKRK